MIGQGQEAIYKMVNDKIIAALDKGVAPWQKPWDPTKGLPRNGKSGKAYRGINVWLLELAGFSSPYWFSYKQVTDLKGNVKKGSKGTQVVFWKWVVYQKKDENGNPVFNADGTPKMAKIPFLRYSTVFNLDQTENMPAKFYEKAAIEEIPDAQSIVDNMPNPPMFSWGTGKAFYAPTLDVVNMPMRESFLNADSYYHTFFHELVHSTGHESRINRKLMNSTDKISYGREELIAEMGASYLSGLCGTTDVVMTNSISYIQAWKDIIKEDIKAVVVASAQAQKAVDWITATSSTNDNEE